MGQRKELQYNFFIIPLTFSDGTLVASFWIMLMYGSYTELFLATSKSTPFYEGYKIARHRGTKTA